MSDQIDVLDTPEIGDPDNFTKAHKIALYSEMGLWALAVVFHLIRFHEGLIIAVSVLLLAYILIPFLVFDSRGWMRHIFAYASGWTIMLPATALLFSWERWEGAVEMNIMSFMPSAVMAVLSLLFYFIRKDTPHGGNMFIHTGLRLALGAIITLPAMMSIFAKT